MSKGLAFGQDIYSGQDLWGIATGQPDGSFWVVQAGAYQLHTDFAVFATDVESRLATGVLVKHVGASGKYEDVTGIITSGLVGAALE